MTGLTLVIGHRGTGKSSFLRRLEGYFKKCPKLEGRFLDLDHEIALRQNRPVARIFEQEGESYFRKLEEETFRSLHAEARLTGAHFFLSVGGGFQAEIPTEVRRLWLRRPTDSRGRIFLDRPRLNPVLSAHEEFLERYPAREARYRELASDTWTLTEGFDYPNPMEELFALNVLVPDASQACELCVHGALTLLPENFRKPGGGFENWIWRRLRWRGSRFEIRDDLLTPEQRERAWRMIPSHRIIYSFRKSPPPSDELAQIHSKGCDWDWPLELGPVPIEGPGPTILSLHERIEVETVPQSGARLEAMGAVFQGRPERTGPPLLKLAVRVHDFTELEEGHAWASKDPLNRAFLPRSTGKSPGRWAWYRMATVRHAPLSFVREAEGTSLDQPSLMDWLRVSDSGGETGKEGRTREAFAAVLGDPVTQSRTPAEHHRFFRGRGIPVLGIPVSSEEWRGEGAGRPALDVLRGLGLRYAAVTSPLKRLAQEACGLLPGGEGGLESINTLYLNNKFQWRGRNTDLAGFRALLAPFLESGSSGDVAVWGGGGTLEAMRAVAGDAIFYSVRTGLPRQGPGAPGVPGAPPSPRIVVWAAGPTGTYGPPHEVAVRECSELNAPPDHWKPERVVDLNYGEDSPGRDYAVRVGARYTSGLAMFQEQARGQRAFWEEQEIHDPS